MLDGKRVRKVDSISQAVHDASDSNSKSNERRKRDGEPLLEILPLLLLLCSDIGLLFSVELDFAVLMLGKGSVSWGCHLYEQDGVGERTAKKVKMSS